MVGKSVFHRTYAHVSLFSELPEDDQRRIDEAACLSGLNPGEHFHVARLDRERDDVALLSYPTFFDAAFPALRSSWKVRLDTGHVVYRTYEQSLNPPILHRKELLLAKDHPRHGEFAALTQAAEEAGLFLDPTRIGFKQQWEDALLRAAVTVSGHELVPVANTLDDPGFDSKTASQGGPIARHLTALSRSYLSLPMQTAIRHGLLRPDVALFDYGCGKGDDVRNLTEFGFQATGWDPHYCPENSRQSADVVNLGFVINVIEDFDERCEAIEKAFALANKLLIVGALIGTPPAMAVRRHMDGVLTSRNTFQKHYSSGELLQFVSAVLDQDALPAAPGVVYAFKDRALETNYLVQRYSGRNRVARALLPAAIPRAVTRPAVPRKRREIPDDIRARLEDLWALYLELGRRPDISEIPNFSDLLGYFRTPGRVFRYVEGTRDVQALERSATTRQDDLRVALALQLFERRKRFRDLDDRLRRDIKAFFGTYDNAQREALALLHGISDVERLKAERDVAAAAGLGYVDEEGHLQLHVDLVRQLPAQLRVFAGAATSAYGDLASADLIKLHVGTGKVTLMAFDDFIGKPLPRMIQRVKVDMREQDFHVFDYQGQHEPPYLYRKSRYINEETENYAEQVAFDEQIESLGVIGDTPYGALPSELATALRLRRWEIDGFKLTRARTIPDLDEKCGRYLTYRQLIECGETWERLRMDNRPKTPDSYNALYNLAINILDPVIEYFGMVKLTYGFCSPALAGQIKGGISPKLDQHAACEHGSRGLLVCERVGAAADFLVEFEDMRDVANWIAENTQFDRLYFYGSDRPIHVSYGPAMSHIIVELLATSARSRIPRRVSPGQL